MGYHGYQLNLPPNPEAVVFVNGAIARSWRGWWWLWRHGAWIRKTTAQATGCEQLKAGICSFKEVLLVSYWQDAASLSGFFRGEAHRKMMEFVQAHPDALCLYNETYSPDRNGKYIHEPQGLATLYQPLAP
ncbi:MAG: DUF4188 domain-containing protein [Chloroflexaceae bacterium]|nr:DUF4188 domain-containing protein [Chloroflexaceae bacterium]